MRAIWATMVLVVALAGSAIAGSAGSSSDDGALRRMLHLPAGVPLPRIPAYDPLTPEKIALGRDLFYDTRLSANQTQSCSSCHVQSLAFTDGLQRPQGSTGQTLKRNAQPLFNLAYLDNYTWASNAITTIEQQIPIPLRNDNPVELGVSDANADQILARFSGDPAYVALFATAFPDSSSGPTYNKITFALASFIRTMTSFGSPYDRYLAGDKSALSEEAKRGLALFNGERLECFHCHSGRALTTAAYDTKRAANDQPFIFFSNGIYNVGNSGKYPAGDHGLADVTLNPRHEGMFQPPSLRNVSVTAPYMHDGSFATLSDVVDSYAAGGRVIADGPLAGDGRVFPNKSSFVRGFRLTDQEKQSLLAYLASLTDQDFLHRPDLGPPVLPK